MPSGTPADISDKNQLSSQRMQAKLGDTPFDLRSNKVVNTHGDQTPGDPGFHQAQQDPSTPRLMMQHNNDENAVAHI